MKLTISCDSLGPKIAGFIINIKPILFKSASMPINTFWNKKNNRRIFNRTNVLLSLCWKQTKSK